MKASPPKFADRFLAWYCNPALLDEIQGDAYELYYREVKLSKRKADWKFIWNVIRFFRLRNIRQSKGQFNQQTMLKSYFISGLRNIKRSPTYSFINIAGLALAVACVVSTFLLMDSFYNLDSFHSKQYRTYLLVSQVKAGDETEDWARSPYLLGSELTNFESVEAAVRIQKMDDLNVRFNETIFKEVCWAVDSSFFNVFDFPIIQGSTNPLNNKNNIVISAEKAVVYFGDGDAVGKELSVKFPDGRIEVFTVSAVVDNRHDESSMHFSFLLPIAHWEHDRIIAWTHWSRSTFVVLKEGRVPSDVPTSVLSKYQTLQNEANTKFQVKNIEWLPITDVASRSYAIVDSLSWDLHPATIQVVGFISLFLLLLASLNYMNVSIAAVSVRIKEIGIRKVIGGNRRQVVIQYLTENFLLCLVAMLAGLFISYTLLIPAFNSLYPISIPFHFSSVWVMVLFLCGLLLFIAFLSGAYPSIYVSSFNAVSILKGKQEFGSNSTLSKFMLGFQFTLSFITIIISLLAITNGQYFEKKDWGYAYHDVLYIPINGQEQFLRLSNMASKQRGVISYAGSQSHIGDEDELSTISQHDKEIQVTHFPVGFNYLETMGVRLIEGRSFNSQTAADKTQTAVINEALVEKMQWANPLQQTFNFHGEPYQVIGVVENFHYEEFDKRLAPAFLHITPETDFEFFTLKAETGHVHEIENKIKSEWKALAPDNAYLGKVQQDVFSSFYRDNRADRKVMYFISLSTLALACMGLFGLVSYSLTRRMKEFSLRKIFGATRQNLFHSMSREYFMAVALSLIIGTGFGYFFMAGINKAIYPEPIPLQLWPLIATAAAMTLSIALTIGSQLYRVIRENAIDTLRNE
jgi:putative ABC transport system permease protein